MSDITKLKLSKAPHLSSSNVAISSDYFLLIDSSDEGKVKRVTADELIWATIQQEMVQKNLRNCGIIIDDNDPTDIANLFTTIQEDIQVLADAQNAPQKQYHTGDLSEFNPDTYLDLTDILNIDATQYVPIKGFNAYILYSIAGGKMKRGDLDLTLSETNDPNDTVTRINLDSTYAQEIGIYVIEYTVGNV